ncbi:MAG TPA: response regulator transcription factor [Nitrospiraceae bacterium]|jgi:DNA-binding NarL/FixJ family response regulator|nr:response regulator transcription factor [Nitrospiraceae bacterium]
MIRVLIADDHAVVRQGLRHVLASEHDMEVSGEAANAQELFDLLRKKSWDAIVLDISLPGRSGLEVLKELKQKWPNLPVVIFTMHDEDHFGLRAMRAGAAGYLTKDRAPSELIKAIRKVVAGGRYVSPSLAEQLESQTGTNTEQSLHQMLSDREFQVLRLLASGKTVTEVAQELTLSVKTVSTYRARILQKLGYRTTAELIQYAIRNQLTL